jgi:hypothetical protein
MDEPVIGQVGRSNRKRDEAAKIEIVGKLLPAEWEEFVACLKECIKRFPGKLTLRLATYSIKVKKVKKKKARR